MWIDLYVAIALIGAVAAWLISQRFQSYDPPNDIVRGVSALVAGALWPVMIVGGAQILAVRLVAQRLRPAHSHQLDIRQFVAAQDLSLRS